MGAQVGAVGQPTQNNQSSLAALSQHQYLIFALSEVMMSEPSLP